MFLSLACPCHETQGMQLLFTLMKTNSAAMGDVSFYELFILESQLEKILGPAFLKGSIKKFRPSPLLSLLNQFCYGFEYLNLYSSDLYLKMHLIKVWLVGKEYM